MTTKTLSDLVLSANKTSSCLDDYDPNSMSVDSARQYIRDFLSPVTETEILPLRETLGRIIASDIISPHNVPNHDNSAMDGYAFNAESIASEGSSQLKIIGTAFAGRAFTGNVSQGECVRIMTGSVIPQGADTVIAQEHVTAEASYIRFDSKPKAGFNVRYAGEDLKQGQVVLATGHQICPADLGLIASLGIGEVAVYRKLRVAFFSTGDELVSIGQPLEDGQLYDSNRYTLFGMLARMGVEIQDLGVVRDDPVLLESTLRQAAQNADVILTSGGVSVGEADYMKQLLGQQGQVLFWKIAMKPGRPLAYGKVGSAHYFGLPGNPVAVMVTFYQFVKEAILVLMGQSAPPQSPLLEAVCTSPIKKLKGRTEFQRGTLYLAEDCTWKVRPTGNQGSGILSSMSLANCFIVLGDGVGDLEAGAKVQVQIMDGVV